MSSVGGEACKGTVMTILEKRDTPRWLQSREAPGQPGNGSGSGNILVRLEMEKK